MSTANDHTIYYGWCKGDFQTRYNNHMTYFRNINYINQMEWSKHTKMHPLPTLQSGIEGGVAISGGGFEKSLSK